MSILQSDIPAGKISFNTLLALSLGIHITFLGGALLFRSSSNPSLPQLQNITVEIQSIDSPAKEVVTKGKERSTARPATAHEKSAMASSSSPAMPVKQPETLPPVRKEKMLHAVQAEALVTAPPLGVAPDTPATVQPKAALPSPVVVPAAAATQSSSVGRSYTSMVRNLIDQQKEYPVMARRSRFEGTVYIKFILARDGRLKHAEVSRSSGRRILDKAAINAVTRVNRFPAVPESMNGSELSFELPLVYKITGD